jgi:hypothetical protein
LNRIMPCDHPFLVGREPRNRGRVRPLGSFPQESNSPRFIGWVRSAKLDTRALYVLWVRFHKNPEAGLGSFPQNPGLQVSHCLTALILLHHKFLRRVCLTIGAAQHGHRGKLPTSATIRRRRMVAIEFGIWRSGRNGGSSGSVTIGNGKLRDERGAGRS